tara:strand:- start:463 stop:792 length:330 start_codon:yes stop_codon:yes gene_type:complete
MKKILKFILINLIAFSFFSGCQSLKEGLEGSKKSNNAEEFLINKKNSLIVPPDFSKLPSPEIKSEVDIDENEFDIGNILQTNSNNNNNQNNNKSSGSLEKSILEKIKSD